jgi:2-iminobutanoate/2-iminopropanoate deaminase
MSVRIAICLAALTVAVGWLGAAPVQNPPEAPFRQAVTAGGYIYVSGIKPEAGAADVAAQTKSVLAQLKASLEANHSSMSQLCSVQVALKHASDFADMNAAYAGMIGDTPPTRTTFVSWMRGNDLIEISAVALPVGANREAMQPAKWAKNTRPYSYIIKTDDLVFFSGLLSRRGTDDSVVKGNVATQTQTVLDNAGTLLETAGLTYDDVVAARVYITSPYDFQDMNDVYGAYFPKAAPARATAVVELMGTDANVEITMLASRQPKSVIGGQAANGLPVSLAIQAGPRVWLSAVIGDTDKHPKDVAAQTRDAFDHFRTTLGLAGLSLDDIVDTTVYMPDTFELPKVDDVFRAIFPKNPPARAVAATRLVVEPALIEMLATAVRR